MSTRPPSHIVSQATKITHIDSPEYGQYGHNALIDPSRNRVFFNRFFKEHSTMAKDRGMGSCNSAIKQGWIRAYSRETYGPGSGQVGLEFIPTERNTKHAIQYLKNTHTPGAEIYLDLRKPDQPRDTQAAGNLGWAQNPSYKYLTRGQEPDRLLSRQATRHGSLQSAIDHINSFGSVSQGPADPLRPHDWMRSRLLRKAGLPESLNVRELVDLLMEEDRSTPVHSTLVDGHRIDLYKGSDGSFSHQVNHTNYKQPKFSTIEKAMAHATKVVGVRKRVEAKQREQEQERNKSQLSGTDQGTLAFFKQKARW